MKNDWLPASPVMINWAVTNRCNFGCGHCYSRKDPSEELNTADVFSLTRKLSDAKIFSLNFGGGEPLLRSDLFDIASHAAGLGIVVSMNSNGFFIDEIVAGRLKGAGFRKVGISIDSPHPRVHDEFRGMPGSHVRAVNALRHLRRAGIETSISSVVSRINVADVKGLAELAVDLETETLNFHNFKCSGLGYANRDSLDLSPEGWRDFYVYAAELKRIVPKLNISLEDPIVASLGQTEKKALVKGSVCGKLSLNIKANGDITPCGFIPVVIGNLKRDDLVAIWRESPVLEKMRGKVPKGKCLKCGHYSECLGGCSARALAVTGDFNNPDPHCWQ